VLAKLDAAAKNGFHTTTATVEFDSIQTDPIPDKDVHDRKRVLRAQGRQLSKWPFISRAQRRNGRVISRSTTANLTCFRRAPSGLSETGKESDAKNLHQASKYESYLMLGFGASGSDLEDKVDR
jgi:hypothetical protein